MRSSATAEDLPDASFAGQQDTILNVRGEQRIIEACHECYASLWTDRAISYRTAKGFDHFDVALVDRNSADGAFGYRVFGRDVYARYGERFSRCGRHQRCVGPRRSGRAGNGDAGRMDRFQTDAEAGFRPIVTRKLGVKEVKMVFADDGTGTQVRDVVETQRNRFCLAGFEVLQLSQWACAIEDHYSKLAGKPQPMDIEWAKDGITGELFILQARPETIHAAEHDQLHRKIQARRHARSTTLRRA